MASLKVIGQICFYKERIRIYDFNCWSRSRLQNSRVFFSKSVKKSVKRGVRVLRGRSALASHARARGKTLNRLSPVSLSVFSVVPDLLFDSSRELEYAKIQTVLLSSHAAIAWVVG